MDEDFTTVVDKVEKAIEKAAKRIALILERSTVEAIDQNNMNASGDLRKSIASDTERIAEGYLIRCFAGVNYSVFAHEGTRPHFPPIAPIIKWVEQKGIAGQYSVKSHRLLKNKQSMNEIKSVAWAIARSIAKKGTPGLKFFEIALTQATSDIDAIIEGLA